MNSDRAGPSDQFWNLPGMKHRARDPATGKRELKLPLIGFLPNKMRNHFIAMAGEFVGTFLFLFFAFSATQVANAAASGNQSGQTATSNSGLSQRPNASTLLYISLAFGFSLAVNAWVFFRISGGLFNPAVTLALALIGAVGWARAGLVFIAQMLGAMSASGIVSALFPGPLNVSTTLQTNTSIVRGLFIEMFATAMLVFTIIMLAAEKHKGTYLAPVGIGLSLFVCELSSVYFTGGSLNPARSFGPCVAVRGFPGYHWIYWLGPLLGALVAVTFYRFVKILEYETANPGQDFNEQEKAVFQFDEENAVTAEDVARPHVVPGQPDYVADETGLHPSREHSAASQQVPGYGGRAPEETDGRLAPASRGGADRSVDRNVNRNMDRGVDRTQYDRAPPSRGTGGGSRRSRESGRVYASDGIRSEAAVQDALHHHDEHHAWHDTQGGAQRRSDGYERGSDAERGELGGRYKVSGL